MYKDVIAVCREFNRFYTSIIGVLNTYILESDYSLTEARAMYEIYHHEQITARQIMELIRVDEGYLSRSITKLEKHGLLKKISSKQDKRTSFLELTKKGKEVFLSLDQKATDGIAGLVAHLSVKQQEELVSSLEKVKQLLTDQ